MYSALSSDKIAMKSLILSNRRRGAGFALALVLLGAVLPASARPLTSRRLERPSSQQGQHSTTSFAEHAVTLSAAGFVELDFFVDSEEEHDFLDLQVDGVVKFRASGADRGGTVKVPLGVGAHQLRFVYSKDGQGSDGADTAWIGRVRVLQGREVVETRAFGESPLGAAPGFIGGGSGGGFKVTAAPRKRSLRRPAAGAFLGYQAGRTVTSVQRVFEWPTGSSRNELLLSFYVDSEEGYDLLRVYVDGQEKFATSGRDRTGRQRIDVGAPGSHTIEIAYDKDASVDVGTDDARILDFQATSDLGTVQLGGFESDELGTLPGGWAVGAHATSGLAFEVGHEPAPRVYAESSAAAVEPDVDGVINSEYEHHSIAKLPNLADPSGKPGELWLETQTTGKRFLALRVPKGVATPSRLTLLVDQARSLTLSGKACGPRGSSPDAPDRVFLIDFAAGLGEASEITQRQGACTLGSSAWSAVAEDDEWVVEASASEPLDDPGFVHVEVKLVPPADATVGDWGLGAIWDGRGTTTSLPRHEGAAPELDDAATWETIRYAPFTESSRVSFLSVDGRPERGAD